MNAPTDNLNHPPRPLRTAPTEPGLAPTVSASLLAYAARDAILDVLPAGWQHLPDGRDTANLLAGTIANHYTVRQSVQVERLALPLTGRRRTHRIGR